jgi:NDP-sugar pyrophosphorylase family protein
MVKTKISITINEKTLQDIDSIIDNIYIRNRSQAIEHLAKNSLGENKTAVILLGGDEGHLKVSEKDYRPTVKIKNTVVVELAVKKLRENNFKTIFVVARQNLLTKLFEILKDGTDYGIKISYIEEKSSGGTADSLKLLKGKISSNFLVVYGDVIFSKINIDKLWDDHIRQNAIATIMLTTSSKPSEKGTVKVEGNKVLSFTQKPKKSDIYLVFSPIFVADPQILEYTGSSLEFNIFPELAEKGLLNGHLSSEKEIHVHSNKNLPRI